MADAASNPETPLQQTAVNGDTDVTDVDLTEEKSAANPDFKGATLELNSSGNMDTEVGFAGPGLDPPKPMPTVTQEVEIREASSRGTLSRSSTTSLGSRTSFSSAVRTGDCNPENYFCTKTGAFETAVEACKNSVVDKELDGEITGAWLLTEIDHWDHERERLVLLTDNSILLVKFDFITQKAKHAKRIFLHIINLIHIGNFAYPENSVMTRRDHGGVRVGWGDLTKITFGQKWNPLASDIPYTTFSHHKLIYNEKERETATFNVDDFYESLAQSVTRAIKTKNPSQSLTVQDGPILIESYASLSSLVFNQSHLGFNRDRNGLSF